MIFLKRLRNNDGITLVELIIALAVLMTGVIAAFNLLIQSLGLTRIVTDRYKASFLAMEGVEIVKNVSDSNAWGAIVSGDYEVEFNSINLPLPSYSSPGRFLRIKDGLYGYDGSSGSSDTLFKRKIEVTYPDDCGIEPRCGDHMKVNSIVTWQSRGGTDFSINLEDHFYNWNQ